MCVKFVDEISAGRRTRVNSKPIITPLLAKIPRSATGATPENENDQSPTAVVREVMMIAKPECPIAYLNELFLSFVLEKSL